MRFLKFPIISLCICSVSALSTNYDLYTSGGIKSGLSADQSYFLLNGKNITIYSGSIHYFRVPRAYWKDRIRKLRALGFNAVETYIAWNLHEPEQGKYDFGDGGSDMTDFLHLEEFIQLAQEEDLFMIIRSGPYICAEFEFGGFPSWLLRENGLTVRSSEKKYMSHVRRWFNILMTLLNKYQFTKGGPIIAFQVENEFAIMGGDRAYLEELRQIMLDNGIVELLVTSDNPWKGTWGTIPEYFLMTGNFNTNGTENLNTLEHYQPGRPKMVMEYWSGWFDYWGQRHHTSKLNDFKKVYEEILSYPASVNIYMFIGGTNFGFLSGAENLNFDEFNTKFSPMTTSYDYGALLSENGDYTNKYFATKKLLAKYNRNTKTITPDVPELLSRVAYPNISITYEISFSAFLETLPNEERSNLVSMENLNINDDNGQSYGYIVYSKRNLDLSANSTLKIRGRVCDTVMVLINNRRVSPIIAKRHDLNNFGTWRIEDSTLTLTDVALTNATLDLIVENWGRTNIGPYKQYKGLWQGGVEINNEPVYGWTHSALEFKKSWINNMDFQNKAGDLPGDLVEPKLFKAILLLEDAPRDTYICMENWTKGVFIINGFVLGRYSKMGPQQRLYLPAPFLRQGSNDVVIFEQFRGDKFVQFGTDQVYKVY